MMLRTKIDRAIYGDVLEYVRVLVHSPWRHSYVDRLEGDRGDFFLGVLTDQPAIRLSREVKILKMEYDPRGMSRGFVRDERAHCFRRSRDGAVLLTSVYTCWAFERLRSRPCDRVNPEKALEDDVWEQEILDAIEEIREAHEYARISVHEPIPVHKSV